MNEFENAPTEREGEGDNPAPESASGIPSAWLNLGLPEARPTDTLDNALSAATTDPAITLGPLIIPGYDLFEEIGRGASGVVFRAAQHNPRRTVAVKMLLAHQLSRDSLARFRQESNALASLQHPGIIQVFEVNSAGGQPYFSMEYCAGGNLAERINGTPLPPREAATTAARLAGAIQKAHEAGIVHRDLKPGNILVVDFGFRASDSPTEQSPGGSTNKSGVSATPRSAQAAVVKISDFGLAKYLDSDDTRTRSGAILGTPSYMAPEQANETSSVTPAADIWSLGAILYEMLTGRPPFKGATVLETLDQVRSRFPVPPTSLNPQTPRDLETICLKCLQKDPRKRYVSAAALAEDLGRWLDGRPIAARPISAGEHVLRWCRRRPALAGLTAFATLAVIVLIAGGVIYSNRLGKAEGDTRAAQSETRAIEQIARAAREKEMAHLYQSRMVAAREMLAQRRLGWSDATMQLLLEAARIETAQRDLIELRSGMAACLTGNDLCEPKPICPGLVPGVIAFGGGKRQLLAVGQFRSIMIVAPLNIEVADPATGQIVWSFFIRAMPVWRNGPVPDAIQSLCFSPDGRWLLAGTRSGFLYRWDLHADSPKAKEIGGGHARDINRIAFARDGKAVYTAGSEGKLRRWDLDADWKLTAEFASPRSVEDVAVLADGRVLVSSNHQLHVLDPTSLKLVAGPVRADGAATLSVCSNNAAVAVKMGRQVGVFALGKTPALIRSLRDPYGDTLCEGLLGDVQYSPDGSLLVTSAPGGEDRHLKIWDSANGRLVSTLFVPGSDPIAPNFSPDGKQLALIAGRKTLIYQVRRSEIVADIASSARTVREFDWSPDSTEVALIITDDEGRGNFALCNIGTGKFERRVPIERQRGRVAAPSIAWSASAGIAWNCDNAGLTIVDPNRPGWTITSKERHEPRGLAFDGRGNLWGALGNQLHRWTIPPNAESIPPSRIILDNRLGDVFRGSSEIGECAAGIKWVVIVTRDGGFHLYGDGLTKPEQQWITNFDPLQSVALSRDESFAVAGSRGGKLHVYDMNAKRHTAEIDASVKSLDAVAIAPDGKLFATGARDGTLKLWRWNGHVELLLSVSWPTPIHKLRFSPDGQRLALLHANESALRVWNVGLLKERLTERGLGW
jgi:eukaryotic-like serine/threonine-protein kinase